MRGGAGLLWHWLVGCRATQAAQHGGVARAGERRGHPCIEHPATAARQPPFVMPLLAAPVSPPQTSCGWRWRRRCAARRRAATSLRRRCTRWRRRTSCRSEAGLAAATRGHAAAGPRGQRLPASASLNSAAGAAQHTLPPPHVPPLRSYCRRIMAPTFWGGEPELLVLSQMLRVPILVYVPSREASK